MSSNKQQTSAFLNVASFLERDELCALFNTFLHNYDSPGTTQVWARLKHFFSLLEYKTKLNASIAARNKRRNLPSLFGETFYKWELPMCL